MGDIRVTPSLKNSGIYRISPDSNQKVPTEHLTKWSGLINLLVPVFNYLFFIILNQTQSCESSQTFKELIKVCTAQLLSKTLKSLQAAGEHMYIDGRYYK